MPEGGFFKPSGGFFVVFAHKFAKEKHHAEVGLRTRQAVFGGGFIEREGLADVLGGAVEAEMTNEGLAVVFFSQLLFWVGQVAHRVGLTALGFHRLGQLFFGFFMPVEYGLFIPLPRQFVVFGYAQAVAVHIAHLIHGVGIAQAHGLLQAAHGGIKVLLDTLPGE